MNILLAVDQSRNALAVTKFVAAIRLPASSSLFLLYVEETQAELEGPDHFPRMFGQLREELSNMRQKTMAKARQLVNRLADPFREQGLKVYPEVVEGMPAPQILTTVEQRQIDLVALGTKGLSGMKRFLLGSVSEWVLHDVSCSVLVVRGRPRWTAATSSCGMHILLAMDGSPDSWNAVAFLKTLQLPRSSHLTILHVVEKPTALITLAWVSAHMDATKFTEDCSRTGREAGAQLLENTRQDLIQEGFEIEPKLTEGHAADEILKAAHDVRADLIVVGSQGVTGLKRLMMLGGVSHKVVQHARCSVLVVRKPGKDS
jgi:nucleotide-binding universal stress UspA family protein